MFDRPPKNQQMRPISSHDVETKEELRRVKMIYVCGSLIKGVNIGERAIANMTQLNTIYKTYCNLP